MQDVQEARVELHEIRLPREALLANAELTKQISLLHTLDEAQTSLVLTDCPVLGKACMFMLGTLLYLWLLEQRSA